MKRQLWAVELHNMSHLPCQFYQSRPKFEEATLGSRTTQYVSSSLPILSIQATNAERRLSKKTTQYVSSSLPILSIQATNAERQLPVELHNMSHLPCLFICLIFLAYFINPGHKCGEAIHSRTTQYVSSSLPILSLQATNAERRLPRKTTQYVSSSLLF